MTSRGLFYALVLALCVGAPVAMAAEDLTSLQAAFLKGEYESVLRQAGILEKRGASEKDALLYLQGVSALKLHEWELARSRLNRLLGEYRSSRWRAQAWLALGDAWEGSGQGEEAVKAYQQVRQEARGGSFLPQAMLRIGKVQLRLGHWEEAKEVLESVVAKAPGTEEGAAARELLRGGEFYFCVQVGAFVNQDNAKRLAEEIKRRSYPAEIQQGMMHGRLFYRVRIGRYSSRGQAEEQARRLQVEGFPAKVFP